MIMFVECKVVLVFKYDAMAAYGEWRYVTLRSINLGTTILASNAAQSLFPLGNAPVAYTELKAG